MQRTALVTIMLALGAMLWATDSVVVGTSLTANRQSAIVKPQSLDAITIPKLLNYQGKLTDAAGSPVPDSTYSVVFRLYGVPSGGSPFWNETQNVQTKSGLFAVLLGAVTPVGSVPDAGALYIGMQVGASELTPRLRLVSAAYAYKADSSAYAAAALPAGSAGGDLAGAYPNPTIGQKGASSGQVLKWTGSTWQSRNDSVGGGDNAWVRGTPDSVLFTIHDLGIARGGANNMLYGSYRRTHVNFGNACTTGTNGWDFECCTVGGGAQNVASNLCATVSGGDDNTASGTNASVGGGYYNTASGVDAVVSGGFSNTASDSEATVGGGAENWAIGKSNTVGGGYQNVASNNFSTIAGGWLNSASGTQATVGGGYADTASANNAVVGGGDRNKAAANYATAGGGTHNMASGSSSTIAGGYFGAVSGNYSALMGGANDTCAADYALVAGSSVRARAAADYTFAFGEGCTTSVPRAVVFYHSGAATKLGVGVQTPTHYVDVTGGSYCDASGWHNGSSWALKKDIAAMTPEEMRELAAQLEDLEVVRFRYRLQDDEKLHVGVIAEDAPDVLVSAKHDALSTGDAIGFLLAVAKAQQAEIESLKSELKGR